MDDLDKLDKEDEAYKFPLDAACKKKSEKELNEKDEERIGSVRALRKWALERQDWLKTPVDVQFLLRFLRVRKFSQLAARKTLENYWTARTKSPEWFADVDTCDPEIQELIGTGYVLVCPGTDKEGRIVCFERAECLDVDWAIKKFGVNKIFKAMIAVFDWVLMDVNAQVNGIVAIEDMTGFNLRHSMAIYNTENTKKFMAIYQQYKMREFRYFRINTPTDKKDGLLIFGVRDLRRLDKCILDLADNLDDYLKIRKNLNDYYLPRRNKQFERNLIPKTRPTPTPGETTVTVVNGPISPRIVWVPRDAYPCRTKGMYLYNEPPIFDPILAVMKQFMKPKLKKRIHMVGRNLTNLYDKVDMDMLPKEYLPDDYKNKVGYAKDVIAYMQREMQRPEVREEILAISSGRYRIDFSKKPSEQEPQASFRKLNVS